MKTIKQSYPRRDEMLATPFEPLSDGDFRELASQGLAIPCQQGSSLFVSKWRDGAGIDPDVFLTAMRAQGSTLVVRKFKKDVNIRVVQPQRKATGGRLTWTPSRTVSA